MWLWFEHNFKHSLVTDVFDFSGIVHVWMPEDHVDDNGSVPPSNKVKTEPMLTKVPYAVTWPQYKSKHTSDYILWYIDIHGVPTIIATKNL